MKKENEEEKENGGNENRDNQPGAGEKGAGGESGAGGSSSSSGSGGAQGGNQGEQGGEQGGSGGEQGGSGSGSGEQKADRKLDLLQSIRNKRASGLNGASSNESGTSHGDSKGNGTGLPTSERGTKDNNGTSSRANRGNRRGGKQDSNGGGGSSESSQTNERATINEKPSGVAIKGADRIKQLAQAATEAARTEAPKLRFQWDDKPLTNKEGDEILPKIKGLLEFIFRHADKGITISNRNRAEAHIWSSIDDEDIDIIAGHLVEMGKASKVVATAVRRMTNSYRLLQIGLITLPKFIQTYQFYAANGGFALGGK